MDLHLTLNSKQNWFDHIASGNWPASFAWRQKSPLLPCEVWRNSSDPRRICLVRPRWVVVKLGGKTAVFWSKFCVGVWQGSYKYPFRGNQSMQMYDIWRQSSFLLGFGGNYRNALKKVVVEDFLGGCSSTMFTGCCAFRYLEHVWHARKCFTKNNEDNGHSCHAFLILSMPFADRSSWYFVFKISN